MESLCERLQHNLYRNHASKNRRKKGRASSFFLTATSNGSLIGGASASDSAPKAWSGPSKSCIAGVRRLHHAGHTSRPSGPGRRAGKREMVNTTHETVTVTVASLTQFKCLTGQPQASYAAAGCVGNKTAELTTRIAEFGDRDGRRGRRTASTRCSNQGGPPGAAAADQGAARCRRH